MSEIAQIENPQPGDITAYRIVIMLDAPRFDELADACKRHGYEVVRVSTPDECLRFLDTKDHADLIVSASNLENENVFELLVRLKSSAQHKDVPILLVCSEPTHVNLAANVVVETAARVLGVDSYMLMLEFDLDKLLEQIDKTLPAAWPAKERNPSAAY